MLTTTIENKILSEIPLARYMGLKMLELSPDLARWACPLAPNRNHLGTAFGGSLYSVSALSCYSLLLGHIESWDPVPANELVIIHGDIAYRAPVTGDFEIEARFGKGFSVLDLKSTLESQGKIRLPMEAIIRAGGKAAAEFTGRYGVKLVP